MVVDSSESRIQIGKDRIRRYANESCVDGDEMRCMMLLCFSVLKLVKNPSSLVSKANLGKISLDLGNQ